jgi:hypothetical protein
MSARKEQETGGDASGDMALALRVVAPVQLSVEVGPGFVDERWPGLMRRIDVRLGSRSLVRSEMGDAVIRRLLDERVFDQPVRLGLAAWHGPWSDGVFELEIFFGGTTAAQRAVLDDLMKTDHRRGISWRALPNGSPLLRLGLRRYFVLAGVEFKTHAKDRDPLLKPVFDRILYGNPQDEIQRVIRESLAWVPSDRGL